MYTNNELLFPNEVIPLLRDQRGEKWRALVDSVVDLEDDHPDKLAFVLMMIRLNGCLDCETDSYRAMRGCSLCATQTLRRFKGQDEELLQKYDEARRDVDEWLEEQEEDNRRIA